MKKLNILLVITKADIGGAQVFVINLAEKLIELGCSVTVVAGEGEYLPEELKNNNIRFIKLNSLKRGYSLLSSISFIKDLLITLNKEHYDLIHFNSTNTLIGVISAWLSNNKPKCIFTMHGLSFLDNNYKMNFIFKFFTKLYFRIFLRFVNETVFVSHANHEESRINKLIRSGSVIINGLPFEKLDFLDKNKAIKYCEECLQVELSDSFILGSVGRLAYQKNYEFLIDNFTRIKGKFGDIKIIIIGDGPYLKKFKKVIEDRNLNDHVFLTGAIKNSYQYIKAFDLYVLPSRYEGLSISLIEAVFAGIPIFASNVSGNREVVAEDNRQLFELNNIDDFLVKLGNCRKNMKKISSYNRDLVGRYSLETMATEYHKLYKRIVNQK